jgi:hypothetical protein
VFTFSQVREKKVKYAYQESPHSENTASPRNEKEERQREHVYIRIFISKGHHKQLTKKRTLRVTAMERSVAKQFATGDLNQVLECTNLTLAPTGSRMNKQAQVVERIFHMMFYSFSHWQKEPDNVAGIENCAVLRMTGKFSDRGCATARANYICFKPQYSCKF